MFPIGFLGYNEQKETLANLSKMGFYLKDIPRMDRMCGELSLEIGKKNTRPDLDVWTKGNTQ